MKYLSARTILQTLKVHSLRLHTVNQLCLLSKVREGSTIGYRKKETAKPQSQEGGGILRAGE